jgi:hypothetical protein
MTKEEFLKIDITKVSQAYYGKDNCCRCGCRGTYYATSYMIEPRSDVDNDKVQEFLEAAQEKVFKKDKGVEYSDCYVNVPFGKNAICIYFDEVA